MIDPELAPAPCPDCGELVPTSTGALPAVALARACPLCRLRDAAALDPGSVAPGPWPRLVLVRGEPLPGGALWVALPAGSTVLDLGDGPRASVVTDGRDRATLVASAPGVRVNGVEVAPGAGLALAAGARVHVAGRELVRA